MLPDHFLFSSQLKISFFLFSLRMLGHSPLGPKVLAESVLNSNAMCMTLPWLTRRQFGLCVRSPEAMASALQGIHLALHECKHQLQERRWNCSDLSSGSTVLLNSAILKRGEKRIKWEKMPGLGQPLRWGWWAIKLGVGSSLTAHGSPSILSFPPLLI